jgi:cytidylate kinase
MSVIAISRGSLVATQQLAAGLSAELGSMVITREDVIAAAESHGLDRTGLSRDDIVREHPPGFWARYEEARKHYLTCFKAALLNYAVKGPIIYHGNLAHILLNEVPFVLRVRVNAPVENRVRMLMEERGFSRERAEEEIKAKDRRRRRWIHFLYDAETIDPVPFDLVLNLRRMTIKDAVELVAAEVAKDPFQRTEQSLKDLRDLHLATVAETHLMNSPGTYGLDLKVTADSATGAVTIRKSPAIEEAAELDGEIEAALADMEGISKVNIETSAERK